MSILKKITIQPAGQLFQIAAADLTWADLVRFAEVGVLHTPYDEVMALPGPLSQRVRLCMAFPQAKQAGEEFLAALRVPQGKSVSMRLDSASARETKWVEDWWRSRQ